MRKQKSTKLEKLISEELIAKHKGNPSGLHEELSSLYQSAICQMLDAEMEGHLGYERYEHRRSSEQSVGKKNSRKGSRPKKLSTQLGDLDIPIPRDRLGKFEPQIVPNGKSMTAHLEDGIIRLYAKGVSVRDIEDEVRRMYGVKISDSMVSRLTSGLMDEIKAWQERPLEGRYLITWVDGIRFKVRHGRKMITKTIYIIIGLTTSGFKQILGIWISETESASYWSEIFTNLKNRGVEDIIFVCSDNLTGIEKSIKANFENSITQICVVHQIRNSLRYVPWNEKKEFAKDWKKIYRASDIVAAEGGLNLLEGKWGHKYAVVIRSWRNNWERLMNYMEYSSEIRKLIYTTNLIESVNRQVRKYTKVSTHFPNDDAALKAVYLALGQMERKWTVPIRNWPMVIAQFEIHFPDRINLDF